jgi:hypothetical protein
VAAINSQWSRYSLFHQRFLWSKKSFKNTSISNYVHM